MSSVGLVSSVLWLSWLRMGLMNIG